MQNMSVHNGSKLSMHRGQPKTFDRRTYRASASTGMPKGMLVRQTKSNGCRFLFGVVPGTPAGAAVRRSDGGKTSLDHGNEKQVIRWLNGGMQSTICCPLPEEWFLDPGIDAKACAGALCANATSSMRGNNHEKNKITK